MASRRRLLWLVRAGLVVFALAPFLPTLLARLGVLPGLRAALDRWFAFQCELDPARMLPLGAVCARCLGIYVGLGLGALIGRPRWRFPWLERWLAAGVAAMVLDVTSEALGWRPAWASLRLATGLALAFPAGVIATLALRGDSRRAAPERGHAN